MRNRQPWHLEEMHALIAQHGLARRKHRPAKIEVVQGGWMNMHPKPPAGLSKAAVAYWRAVTRDYELAFHELNLLGELCYQMDRISLAREAIRRDSAYIPGRFGVVAHPALAAERASVLIVSRLQRQLGLADVDH